MGDNASFQHEGGNINLSSTLRRQRAGFTKLLAPPGPCNSDRRRKGRLHLWECIAVSECDALVSQPNCQCRTTIWIWRVQFIRTNLVPGLGQLATVHHSFFRVLEHERGICILRPVCCWSMHQTKHGSSQSLMMPQTEPRCRVCDRQH